MKVNILLEQGAKDRIKLSDKATYDRNGDRWVFFFCEFSIFSCENNLRSISNNCI